MRERAQASVETIALMAVGRRARGGARAGRRAPRAAVRLGAAGQRSPASSRRARRRLRDSTVSSARCSPAPRAPTPTAPRCSTCARTCARASIAAAADAAFAATLRPLVERALAARDASSTEPVDIAVVDRAAEDAWVRDRLHPGAPARAAVELAAGRARLAHPGTRGRRDLGDRRRRAPATAIPPGHAAGDVIVRSTRLPRATSCSAGGPGADSP